jgi:hypothetical protein
VQRLLYFQPALHFSVDPMFQLLVNAPELGVGVAKALVLPPLQIARLFERNFCRPR